MIFQLSILKVGFGKSFAIINTNIKSIARTNDIYTTNITAIPTIN